MIKRCTMASFMLAIFLILSGTLTVSAENIGFVPSSATIASGNTTNVQIILDSVPRGLAGYKAIVSLSGTGAGQITSFTFPAWAGLHNATAMPSDSVEVSAVDLGKSVEAGATNVNLGTITLMGAGAGDLTIGLTVKEMDADGGAMLNATVTPAHITIQGTGTTVTPTATASATASSKPTATANPTGTATATGTVTVSPSGTPIASVSTTPTESPTNTPAESLSVVTILVPLFVMIAMAVSTRIKKDR